MKHFKSKKGKMDLKSTPRPKEAPGRGNSVGGNQSQGRKSKFTTRDSPQGGGMLKAHWGGNGKKSRA